MIDLYVQGEYRFLVIKEMLGYYILQPGPCFDEILQRKISYNYKQSNTKMHNSTYAKRSLFYTYKETVLIQKKTLKIYVF